MLLKESLRKLSLMFRFYGNVQMYYGTGQLLLRNTA